MIVVATDAPLSDRNLRRLASRAILGSVGRGVCVERSGDYALAFSTNQRVRRPWDAKRLSSRSLPTRTCLACSKRSSKRPRKRSTIDAQSDHRYTSNGRTVEALPIDRVREILREVPVVDR